jgi:hypothetical protein
MREKDRKVGRADNTFGERSTAEGETQPPNEALVDENARLGRSNDRQELPGDVEADRRHEASADLGGEGSADTSPEGGKPERKPRA